MTYTRRWTKVVSPNRPKNQMDDAERELRVDVGERMQDLLGGVADWTADPVDDKLTGFSMFLHWSRFKRFATYVFGTVTSIDTLYNHGFRVTTGGSITLAGQVRLPKGAVLVDVYVHCVTVVNTTIATTVYAVDASTGTPTRTSLATRSLTGVNAQGRYSVSSGAGINATIGSDDNFVEVEVTVTNSSGGAANFGFHGIEVTYTRGVFNYA